MATKRSGTVFVQTGEVVQETPVEETIIVPKEDPVIKARRELKDMVHEKDKLKDLASQSTVIFETQSVFPFQLFPDRLIVESDKVTIVHRTFAWKGIFPILLDNLNSVSVNRGLLFAALSFELTGYENNPGDIVHLWPENAAKAKRYIMGLLNAKKQGVDISKIPITEIKDDLEKIGKSTGEIETLPMT
jgi:hypothetical protein